jgi:hypothetical protein
MTTLIKSLAILAVVSLTACNSETVQEQLEEGTWVAASGALANCDDPNENETIVLNTSPCTATSGECEYIRFTFSDGVVTVTTITADDGDVETDQEQGTYSIDEDDILTFCFDGECNSGPASVEDDVATLVFLDIGEGCNLTYTLRR